MKYCVFIQANRRQWLGAVVAAHALRRNSRHSERFAVRIMAVEDFPCLQQREGQRFLRGGEWRIWRNDDLQSFTPLRFAPPELMGYQGRALVIDPDVFAQGDVWELLSRDMGGHAIRCRAKTGRKGRGGAFATSVMLLDCAQLRHWNLERDFGALFRGERDYMDWIGLHLEDPATIGPLEPEWNDFDHLTPQTRMLHNTKRWTQPWKTGLPVDFRPADSFRLFPPRHWLRRAARAVWRLSLRRALSAPSRPGPGAVLFPPARRMSCCRRGRRGAVARRDRQPPPAPRRLRGAGAGRRLSPAPSLRRPASVVRYGNTPCRP